MKKVLLFALFLWFNTKGYGQVADSLVADDIQIESKSDNDIAELTEQYSYLWEHKININHAGEADLAQLAFLSNFQLKSLWMYVEKNRPLVSVYELLAVAGFDHDDLLKVQQFISVDGATQKESNHIKNSVMYLQQFGQSIADDTVVYNAAYKGKMTRSYVKLSSEINKDGGVSFTGEKDPGERFGKQGYDYYSATAWCNNVWGLGTVIVGDFSAKIGQGLVLWNGYAGYSIANTTSLRKRANGVTPYTGIDENLFYRGVALHRTRKNYDVSCFVSSHYIDGHFTDSTHQSISTLETTGLHRTAGEIADKHTVLVTSAGCNATLKLSKLSIGATHVNHFFDKEIVPPDRAYNVYAFKGQSMSLTGANYYLNLKQADFFGEWAVNETMKKALVSGAEFTLPYNVLLSTLYRNYSEGYDSYMNLGFSESGKTANEKGLYTVMQIPVDTSCSVLVCFDVYNHQWLTYTTSAPAAGQLYGIVFQKSFTDGTKIAVQCKRICTSKNTSLSDEALKVIGDVNSNVIKVSVTTKMGDRWRFITQGVCSFAQSASTSALFFSQDVSYAIHQKWSIDCRYAVFDATYANRIYVYESNAGFGSSSAFFGSGSRVLVKTTYSARKWLKFTARFARTAKETGYTYAFKNECTLMVHVLF